MKPEEVSNFKIGSRIYLSGHRGTIMYVGEVINTEGLWLGIDWDSPERGKHDGSLMGIRYFTASYPTSGSFVRPKNVSTGITIMEGIQSRYGEIKDGSTGLDYEKIDEVKRKMRAKVFEVVGAQQLNKHLSNFNNLKTVVLQGMLISGAGPPLELYQMCPNIRELHLASTLLSSWETVSEIVGQLKHITVLNVSSNRLKIVETLPSEPFSPLKHVIMGRMNYNWEDVLKCCKFMLNVETVQVPFNNIHSLRQPPKNILSKLSSLDLEGNKLESWQEVNKLGMMETLKFMNLRGCGLTEINFPSCGDAGWTTSLFINLESLVLSNNLLDDWVYISELDKLNSLVDVKIKENPILEKEKPETSYGLIVARITKLVKLNGTTIFPEDRRGCEIDYLKRYGLEWLALKDDSEIFEFQKRHPCYPKLVRKYGPPDPDELKDPVRSLKSKLIQIEIFSPNCKEKSYLKKVPNNMSVQKLVGLTQRLFNTGCKIPRLTCIYNEGSGRREEVLDNDMKDLHFYSVEDGDKIAVSW